MKRKNLYNVGALLAGMFVTFKFMFKRKPTIQYPSRKKKHAPRFHGLHELRRYGDGKERCIGCELCSSVCPANAITVIGAENAPGDWLYAENAKEIAVHKRAELHLRQRVLIARKTELAELGGSQALERLAAPPKIVEVRIRHRRILK